MNIDLLPRPARKGRLRMVFRVSLLLLLGLWTVLSSISGQSAERRAVEYSGAARAVKSTLPDLAARVDGVKLAVQEARRARAVAEYLRGQPDAARIALRFLKDLPRPSAVDELAVGSGGISARVAAHGFAGVAGIVRSLEGDPLFGSVTVTSAQAISGGSGREVVAVLQLSLRRGTGLQP